MTLPSSLVPFGTGVSYYIPASHLGVISGLVTFEGTPVHVAIEQCFTRVGR